MKPLRLEISGFGSFPGREVIDFTSLEPRGLFVVTGPTGSGKTTIFDAMVFALYGDLPGGRGVNGVRSDHAPVGQKTEVVFDFAIDGVAYRVTRNPDYERPKVRGDGVTKEKASATLVRLDEHTTTTEATGARQCQSRCAELVGLDKAQFERVVLLPQGEFDQFLTANEEDREKLLSKLFGGAVYSRVIARLRDHAGVLANEAAQQAQQIAHQRDVAWGSVLSARSVLDGLGARVESNWVEGSREEDATTAEPAATPDAPEISAAHDAEAQRLAALEPELQSADHAARTAREAAADADSKAKVFDGAAELRRQLTALDERRDAIESQQLAVAQSSAARTVVAAADLSRTAAAAASAADDVVARLRAHVHEVLGALACPAASDAEPEPSQVAQEIAEARSRVEAQSNQLAGAASATAKLHEALETHDRAHQEHIAAMQRRESRAAEFADAEAELVVARAEAGKSELAQRYLDDARVRQTQRNDLDQLRSQLATLESDESAAHRDYVEVMSAYVASEGPRLAQQLIDGKPCMVCGSIEHPAPAVPDAATPTVDHEQVDVANTRWANARGALATLRGQVAEKDQGLGADADTPRDALDAAVAEAEAAVAAARAADEAAGAAEGRCSAARDALENATRAVEECAERVSKAAGTLEERQAEAARLEAVVTGLDAEAVAREQGVLDGVGTMVDDYSTATNDARSRRQSAGEAAARAETALAASPFADADTARAALLDEVEEATQRAEVKAWEDGRAEAQSQLAGLLKIGIPESRPDNVAAQATAAGAEARRNTLRDGLTTAGTHLTSARSALDHAEKLERESADLRARAQTARVVADTCAGRGGRLRMKLDRWVLAAELERVADAANVHLDRLTRRYQLRRSIAEGNEKLDLVVFDTFTGAERATATLSGGEKFQASLALALGLADVVSHGGTASGRDYEALFVDEGFGSLDPDSLDQAIAALASLQQGGRMVGAITHVEAMKQQLHVGIEVQRLSDTGGSTLVVHP